jgi:hypothetical protein
VTTIQAQINSVNVDGKATVGLVGVSTGGALTGYLATGIDAHGNVFVVEQASSIRPTIVPIGWDTGYTGGPISVTFTINSTGVKVTARSFESAEIPFSALHGFSLRTGFVDGATSALVEASQPNQKGGSASFGSIRVII